MAAAGRVVTGFSKPYVARYTENAGEVTYSDCQQLARGVDVDVQPTVSEGNNFSADNVTAETAPGIFTGGTCNLTVDGLFVKSERFIMGLKEAKEVEITEGEKVKVQGFGDEMQIPYMGLGFIVRYQSDGVVEYVPTILTKVRFNTTGLSAETQDGEMDWQTTQLTAKLHRDDTPDHEWKKETEEGFDTEEKAERILKALLGVKVSPLALAADKVIAKGNMEDYGYDHSR